MSACPSDLRDRIAELAAEDGEFYLACPETGDRPTPVADHRFPTERAADEAADLATEYRTALREADPDLPERSLVVYEVESDPLRMVATRERAPGQRANGLPRSSRTVTLSGDDEREWLRMDNAPLVHVRRDGEPLPDDAVSRQLDSKL
ncbi:MULTISPECIES: DUF7552 domain-containing protein [Halorussus]|uniref:DUF7552 domain-containing protein n=1 Tax=Halorussus TaxID=1070314 RepID=UPI0020A0DC2F|nr:hypothetical protein [Halorussus vallis]USZ76169.1 hypothetical protein NGM07_02310 [Halorussus vallis]